MDFSLTKEQEMLKKEAHRFLEKECTEEFVREIEKGDLGYYSKDLWKKIADLGWLGLIFPEQYGGLGGNLLDLAFIYEEMGKAMFPGPHLSTVVLCGTLILAAGTEKQKKTILPEITEGRRIFSLALTEPDSAWGEQTWEAAGISVKADLSGGQRVIDGVKLFVHDGLVADTFICAARTGKTENPEDGITLFLVDAKAPGITVTPLKTIANDKQCEVVFNRVRVAESDILGPVHGGWPFVEKALQAGAVMLCAQMTGAGEELLRLAVEHAKNRVQFDAPVGINQYVQGHCTDLVSDVDGCRYVTHQAAWKLSTGGFADYEAAVAKAWASEAFERA
jgi:3-oxocholest-4-en-26-oyl-CoA dehydrogenase beta subunit